VIDIHCHILPGVDDGPRTMDDSIAMAREAAEDGVETVVATPHLSEDYPLDPAELDGRVAEVNAALAAAGVDLSVLRGAEVSLGWLVRLDRTQLTAGSIGSGSYLLLELPHTFDPNSIERIVWDLQLDGFHPVLAHTERYAPYRSEPERLRALIELGVASSITATAVGGLFGRTVQKTARGFLRAGLVHDVASDSHGVGRRTPRLSESRAAVESAARLKGGWEWLTRAVPAAIVAGEPLPSAPPRASNGGALWQRVARDR
jgi:protein-tyrosine phosphatase